MALTSADIEMVSHLMQVSSAAVLAGAFVGGVLFSLSEKVWTHVGDRLAEKLDAHRAEQVVRLQAECWRLRARAAGRAQ